MANVELPSQLESLETYEYLGFTRATAAAIWERFLTMPEDMPAGFWDFAVFQVESPDIPDATSGCDDWDEMMVRIGIRDELRAAILLPEFEDIRYTATCKFWVLDAMEMRFETLRSKLEKT